MRDLPRVALFCCFTCQWSPSISGTQFFACARTRRLVRGTRNSNFRGIRPVTNNIVSNLISSAFPIEQLSPWTRWIRLFSGGSFVSDINDAGYFQNRSYLLRDKACSSHEVCALWRIFPTKTGNMSQSANASGNACPRITCNGRKIGYAKNEIVNLLLHFNSHRLMETAN